MVEKFCVTSGMSPMPTIYKGPMNFKHVKSMVNKPVLGQKRDGILVIPNDRPTRYIWVNEKADTTQLAEGAPHDIGAFNSLCEEYANRAFDESHFKDSVKSETDIIKFVRERNDLASKNILLLEYIQRCDQEAGVQEPASREALKHAVLTRSTELWKRYQLA